MSSNSSNYIVTSGDDYLVNIWQIKSDNGVYLKPICTLSNHTNWVYETLEVSSVPDMLASASKDGTVRFWSISTCAPLKTLSFDDAAEVISLSNYPGGTYIVSGDSFGRIIRWNVVSGDKFLLATLPSKVNDLWLLGGANQYLGASTSKNCKPTCDTSQTSPFHDRGSVWLLNTDNLGLVYNDPTTYTNRLVFVYGDTSISDDSILDLPSDSTDAHSDSIRVIDPLNEIADQFATASADFTTRVWSISNKNLMQRYEYHTREIRYSLDHYVTSDSPLSYNLIDGSADSNVHTYSVPTKSEFNPLVGAYTTGQYVVSMRLVNGSKKTCKRVLN